MAHGPRAASETKGTLVAGKEADYFKNKLNCRPASLSGRVREKESQEKPSWVQEKNPKIISAFN